MEALAGIAFLSTPHNTLDTTNAWQRAVSILRSNLRVDPEKLMTSEDATLLANVSYRFEQMDLACPILSVFETKPTKVHRFWASKVLVCYALVQLIMFAGLPFA
jgi:hypothetical protein